MKKLMCWILGHKWVEDGDTGTSLDILCERCKVPFHGKWKIWKL